MKQFKFLKNEQKGIAIIEALLALVVILIGILGLGGVQMKMAQSNAEAYQRAQALILLSDMAERLNAHRQIAGCFAFTDTLSTGSPYIGQGDSVLDPSTIDCSGANHGTGNSTIDAQAKVQLLEWEGLLKGTQETSSSGNSVGGLPGARGCISFEDVDGMRLYTIAVAWQGMHTLFPPPVHPTSAARNCAKDSYGDEALRRLVWTTVRTARLK